MKNIPQKIYLIVGEDPDGNALLDMDNPNDSYLCDWGTERQSVHDLEYHYNPSSQWISVDVKLPEPMELVIIFDQYHWDVRTAYRGMGNWNLVGGVKPLPHQFVKFWMPLPKPPINADSASK